MTFTHALATNNYGPAKFIVSASAANGTHTTIGAALAVATSGDTIFIRNGSYTENLALVAGVNLAGWTGDSDTPEVTIIGKCTFTAAGTVTISNVKLQTNSDFILAVTGTLASIVNLNNCVLNCTNNTGISFTTSSASAQINIRNSTGDLGTTGITYFVSTSAGTIRISDFYFTNSGSSTTASSASAGGIIMYYGYGLFPISTSSTGAFTGRFIRLDTSGTNTLTLTMNGTGNTTGDGFKSAITDSDVVSGSAACLTIGALVTVSTYDSRFDSTTTNVVTGAGILVYGRITFTNTGIGVNTTTLSTRTIYSSPFVMPLAGSSGTVTSNTMSTYEEGTFTPTFVGQSTAGTTTYNGTQFGYYTKIGNMCFLMVSLNITSATGTGNILIGGFPFTVSNSSGYQTQGACKFSSTGYTWPTGCTNLTLEANNGAASANIKCTGSTKAEAIMAIANTACIVVCSLAYKVN